jgi:hypothetical protein
MILTNAIVIGSYNFSKVLEQNIAFYYFEPIFATFLVIEALMLIIARGFSEDNNSYIY